MFIAGVYQHGLKVGSLKTAGYTSEDAAKEAMRALVPTRYPSATHVVAMQQGKPAFSFQLVINN